jgi:hypothetical protein
MSGGYTYRAIFVGNRLHPRERDPNAPYPLLLKPSGQDARYLYFAMQAPPVMDENTTGHCCYRLTFRKTDGRQLVEGRSGQVIVGGWQLKKPEERAS